MLEIRSIEELDKRFFTSDTTTITFKEEAVMRVIYWQVTRGIGHHISAKNPKGDLPDLYRQLP